MSKDWRVYLFMGKTRPDRLRYVDGVMKHSLLPFFASPGASRSRDHEEVGARARGSSSARYRHAIYGECRVHGPLL